MKTDIEQFREVLTGKLTGQSEAMTCWIIAKHLQGMDVESMAREMYAQYNRRLSIHYFNSIVWLYKIALSTTGG